jgi:hypothetical protein
MADREMRGDHELTTFQIDPARLCAVSTDDEIIVFLSEDETVTFNREAARLIAKTLATFFS